MNLATKNILHSIILKFGTDITYDSRLCDAYLSDLMPDFPQERYLLVAAVKSGLTAQLMTDSSESNITKLIFRFAEMQNLSFQQANDLLRTWVFALQGQTHANSPLHREPPQRTKNYLRALVTGMIVFVVSSAIAVYKAPEPYTSEKTTTLAPATEQKLNTESINEMSPIVLPQQLIVEKKSEPEKTQTHPQNKDQTDNQITEAETAIEQLMSESVIFGRNAFLLKRKNTDLDALVKLYKKTHDKFFKTQNKKIADKIHIIENTLNTSSERYIKKLQSVCIINEKNPQVNLRTDLSNKKQGHIEKTAATILQKHISNCSQVKSLNAERIKNDLITSFNKFQ